MGYSATSMNNIAKKIGIRASSLYNHIDSKQEILSNLLLTIANKFHRGIVEANNMSCCYREKLQEIIKAHIRVATENQDITALVTQDWKHLEEPSLSRFLEIRQNYQDIFKSVIDKGIAAGELKSTNLEITLNVILSSLRWVYYSKIYADTSNVGLEELERTLLEIVFKGIDTKADVP